MKKTLIIIGSIIGVILVAILIYLIQTRVMIGRGQLMKWEDQWYTQEEFRQLFPSEGTEAPSQNTPEEVYRAFRQALLDNDIEIALAQIREEKREQYREAFMDEKKLNEWAQTLPIKINNIEIDQNHAYYNWDKKDGYKHEIGFIKNQEGYWQIDII